jgi:hypothetical protein
VPWSGGSSSKALDILSLMTQTNLLDISRRSPYNQPVPSPPEDMSMASWEKDALI